MLTINNVLLTISLILPISLNIKKINRNVTELWEDMANEKR